MAGCAVRSKFFCRTKPISDKVLIIIVLRAIPSIPDRVLGNCRENPVSDKMRCLASFIGVFRIPQAFAVAVLGFQRAWEMDGSREGTRLHLPDFTLPRRRIFGVVPLDIWRLFSVCSGDTWGV